MHKTFTENNYTRNPFDKHKPSNEPDKGTNYDSSYQENQAAIFDCLGNNNSSFSDLFRPTPFWKILKQDRKSVYIHVNG